MELIKIDKTKDTVKVLVKVGETELPGMDGIKPKVNQLNEILFNNLEEAQKFYNNIKEHNVTIIKDNQTRLGQMPVDSLKQVNEFAEIIGKTKALSKRNSEKIEGLIKAHENMIGFQRNIEKTIEQTKQIDDILKALE